MFKLPTIGYKKAEKWKTDNQQKMKFEQLQKIYSYLALGNWMLFS